MDFGERDALRLASKRPHSAFSMHLAALFPGKGNPMAVGLPHRHRHTWSSGRERLRVGAKDSRSVKGQPIREEREISRAANMRVPRQSKSNNFAAMHLHSHQQGDTTTIYIPLPQCPTTVIRSFS